MAKATKVIRTTQPIQTDVPQPENPTMENIEQPQEGQTGQEQQLEQETNTQLENTASDESLKEDGDHPEPNVQDDGVNQEADIIDTPIAPAVVEPVAEPVAPVVVQKAVVEEVVEVSEFTAFLGKVQQEGNVYRVGIVNALNSYTLAMKPGLPIEPKVAVRHHYMLWRNIRGILEQCPEEEFRSTWNVILAYFKLNINSALGDKYIFRFMHEWDQGIDQCAAFQSIINLIKLTMDPEQRAIGLKQISLERAMPEVLSEAGRSKLISFYQ